MSRRQGMTRSQMHDWEPAKEEGKVTCKKCGITVLLNDARRGIGPCGSPVKAIPHEPTPEEIKVSKPELKPFKPSGKDQGICNACGQPLREMPLNSRLAMVACNNRKCNLYRVRLRWLPMNS